MTLITIGACADTGIGVGDDRQRAAVFGLAAPRLLSWVMAVALSVVALPDAKATGAPTLDEFFRSSQYASALLSPSGKHVAVAVKVDGHEYRQLAIIDVLSVSKPHIVASLTDADVTDVAWVNDERLVFRAANEGLFAVDREGLTQPRELIRRWFGADVVGTSLRSSGISAMNRLHAVLRDGSHDVLVSHPQAEGGKLASIAVYRMDTTTGRVENITHDAPKDTLGWAGDAKGVMRLAVSRKDGKLAMHWRESPQQPWVKVREVDSYDDRIELSPLLIGPDNLVYASARFGAADDKSTLVSLDMRNPDAPSKTLVALNGYDFSGTLVGNRRGDLLGAHFLTDAVGTVWFDSTLKRTQAQVDRQLPDTVNVIDCGNCENVKHVVVQSGADRQPVVFFLYDVDADKLRLIGASRPWINSKLMATRDLIRFKARDGLEIPLHVTRPRGVTGSAPMVVLVHGGPFVRGGDWRWDASSQFLASRGYVVIEPEFRGSQGFGYKHFRAGWKQWGLGMQDDVADAALWAIKQGWADPKRICIAGASYGGYATMMGLVTHPELFRCGVNWVGVTDIDMLYSVAWSDLDESFRNHGLPKMVGDRVKDAAQIAATSPLKRASEIKQPVLMAYGEQDMRVPLDHGVRMRDALKPHNRDVEWVVYPDEGHGFRKPVNNIDFWSRVEKFLARNLKAER